MKNSLPALHVNKLVSIKLVLSGHAHSKSLLGFSKHKCEHESFEHGFGTFKLELKLK
jgi:hypothetical protein